jgi:hypothetical protein
LPGSAGRRGRLCSARAPLALPRTMLQVPLSAAYFQGAASVQPHTGGGLQPWRLPHSSHHLFPSPDDGLLVKASHGSGVRLHFTSATTAIELEYDPLTPVDPNNKEMSPHSFDVTIDGEIVANALADGSSARLELPPAAMTEPRTLEVWLPQGSAIVLRSLAIDAGTTALIEPDPRPVWVTYGSSLTHCTRANSPACTWPALVARKYNLHLISLGFGGDCHLEPMLGFHIRDLGADYITLKLGINTLNTLGPRTFPGLATGLIHIIREACPNTPLTVVSPMSYPPNETEPSATGNTMEKMRADLEEAVIRRCDHHADTNLRYVDGLLVFNHDEIAEVREKNARRCDACHHLSR